MDQNSVGDNLESFFASWIQSGCFQSENWKFAVKRVIAEMENFSADLPKLATWFVSGLLQPLFKNNTLKISDLVWYNEEEKDELFDVSNQYKIAALVLNFFLTQCNKAPQMLKEEFVRDHGAAFEHLDTVFMDPDRSEFKESFLEEHISASNVGFITEVLKLQ